VRADILHGAAALHATIDGLSGPGTPKSFRRSSGPKLQPPDRRNRLAPHPESASGRHAPLLTQARRGTGPADRPSGGPFARRSAQRGRARPIPRLGAARSGEGARTVADRQRRLGRLSPAGPQKVAAHATRFLAGAPNVAGRAAGSASDERTPIGDNLHPHGSTKQPRLPRRALGHCSATPSPSPGAAANRRPPAEWRRLPCEAVSAARVGRRSRRGLGCSDKREGRPNPAGQATPRAADPHPAAERLAPAPVSAPPDTSRWHPFD
jgi:hypothetical protein